MKKIDLKDIKVETIIGEIGFNGYMDDYILIANDEKGAININGEKVPFKGENLYLMENNFNDNSLSLKLNKTNTKLVKCSIMGKDIYIWVSNSMRKFIFKNALTELTIVEYFKFISPRIKIDVLEKELLKNEYGNMFVNGNAVHLNVIIEIMLKGISLKKYSAIKDFLNEIPIKVVKRIENVIGNHGFYLNSVDGTDVKYVGLRKTEIA